MPFSTEISREDETADQKTIRYLQYTCSYRHCNHQNETWGFIHKNDYPHFKELMCEHVPIGSNTFDALKSILLPSDLKEAMQTVRFMDTPVARIEQRERYLDLECTHKGRMHGKTWRNILKNDYQYFMWSVGNTMGRHTRTFNILVDCLDPEDAEIVRTTHKGSVRTKKKKNSTNVTAIPPPVTLGDFIPMRVPLQRTESSMSAC